jgi:hypothetical protein
VKREWRETRENGEEIGGDAGREGSDKGDTEGERDRERGGEKDKKTSTQEGQVHSNVDSLKEAQFNERKE